MANVRNNSLNNLNSPSPTMNFKQRIDSRYGPGVSNQISELEQMHLKLAKHTNDLTFLTKCKLENIIPTGFKLKSPFSSFKASKIMNTASKSLIIERIEFHRNEKRFLKTRIENKKTELATLIGSEFQNILQSIQNRFNKESENVKLRQKSKLEKLRPVQTNTNLPKNCQQMDANNRVVNLSSRNLNQNEISVLTKGLNFSVVPKSVKTLDFVTGIESAVSQLSEVQGDQFRCEASLLLNKIPVSKPNLTHEECRAVSILGKDDTIKILPADKGNATVVLDTALYKEKISETLQAGKYTLLNKDPTESFERKVASTLRKHKQFFSDKLRTRLTPHHSKTPHMYGLPKIHKPEVPLRPIISSRDSPCRELSKVLLDILKPLVGKTDSFIKNSKDFVEKSKGIVLADTDRLVSFDVESLFTNVPVPETLKIIESRLEKDVTLFERTKLPVKVIMELLELCTQCNFFELEGKLYRQDEGMAMGSPLSPIFANIFMEEFEKKALSSAQFKPKIWWRYVDDTFVVFSHGNDKLIEFLGHLNSISPSIRLTMEEEVQNKLAFLDVCVEKDRDTLRTTVFRKKTHTGQYLNFQSNHQTSVKEGVAYSLFDRAKSICSNQDGLNEEIKRVEEDLINNGYPRSFVKKCKNRRPKPKESENNTEKFVPMSIPYVPGLSEKIRRVARKFKIRTAFKTQNTLRQCLVKTKPKNGTQDSKNCIYRINCKNCARPYYGETKRPLNTRIKEHRENTKKGLVDKSKIAQHCWSENHHMDFEEAKIIHREPHFFKRKLIEASYIKLADQPISQSSVEIRPIWLPILKKELKNREIKYSSNTVTVKSPQNSHGMLTRSKARVGSQVKI